MVGRHRLGHPDRRVRWPDAGRSSLSDAAYRGIANGMSGKSISIGLAIVAFRTATECVAPLADA
ncbi:MAG: hypothetical protein QOJ46_1466 [bacterium]|jgi:hypothetical protein